MDRTRGVDSGRCLERGVASSLEGRDRQKGRQIPMRAEAIRSRDREGRAGEGGFALVLAILSLMLLTFLGLAMATATSTELQIATNYRWSQQALYNAEAGLEAARTILANAATPLGWTASLPGARTVAWSYGSPPTPAEYPGTGRDFEMRNCDLNVGGTGYGLVMATGAQRWEDVSSFQGQSLNGSFTLWVRRPLVQGDGTYVDDSRMNVALVTAEGVAPYIGQNTFTRARQAVRVLETRYALGQGFVCRDPGGAQEGLVATGENFNPCAGLETESLIPVFGAPNESGTGSLERY